MDTAIRPVPAGRSGGVPVSTRRLLMCAPDAYGVNYEINAWMSVGNPPDIALAARQWAALHRTLTQACGAAVELVQQVPGAPDMVFTANAGLLCDHRVMMARFRHPQRQVEEAPFRAWFGAHGYELVEPPTGYHFEGEGDALFAGDVLVAAYLTRTDIETHRWLSDNLGIPVLSVELVDPRWYHLDTAFCALSPGTALWHPGAFDRYGRAVLQANFELIAVPEDEALRFACNSVVVGKHAVVPSGCPRTSAALEARGYAVHPVEMSEFMKSGGAAKCLTLFLR